MADTAIFDVDGTLVDTNYQHALAWYRAFRRYDITPAVWRIHRAIGMGGDNLVTAIAGEDVEKAHGDELRAAWTEEFEPMLDEIQPFEGARALIDEVASRGFRLVLASSGQKAHVEHFLDLLGGREVADAWTTSDDVDATKPQPDLVGVALQKVDGASGVMIGDSVWDAVAAGKLDVPTIAVRTGGFSEAELREAGAFRVYESLVELHENLDGGPLARSTR
ncbi:MAG: HAD family hydrolase [Microbacterium sp.]|uniref:HAD family hydrolase n=1 Tax=Microbacterium sp. TaxID=51671 RepID=UPI000C5BE757|nr:HAD family hydrolase [Microbacterium sp.]MAY50661.1 HAD family hydrolase [Microbacterium sp.]HAS31812.1 HAD family hydrolase [Microbacterium sp.]HBS75310.1 HAD family hydrolase [Microbacterium sp.]|tara:strand:- start:61053 stop:61715 length:663 start_codon:yes stop_codon:yes gene_type:complete